MNDANLVAVVDDDPDMRAMVGDTLKLFGFRVELFGSAEDFLSVATSCPARCLLLDVQLGEMSGLELADHLALLGLTFRIVFMTASANRTVRRQAHEAGCVAYLDKPFPTGALLDAVRKAIAPH